MVSRLIVVCRLKCRKSGYRIADLLESDLDDPTPAPGWNVSASIVHGGVTTTVYSFPDFSSFIPQFVDVDTGAEQAVISTGIASLLYDSKIKRLIAPPYVISVL